MRIAHLEAGRHLYGGAAQVGYLIDGLTARGVDNVLFCPTGSALAEAPPAAHVRALPMQGELDVLLRPRLVSELKRWRPDLVHVHSRRGADLYGGLAATLAGIPAVITRRVDSAELPVVARLKYAPYRTVVALSRAIERQLLEAGVPPASVVRIPSAVDTQRYRPDAAARDRLRAAFALPADALIVGVVAQLIERKGHSRLFAVLPELVCELPQLRVLCFGRGPLEQRLKAELVDRGLTQHVSFAGFRADLPELMPGFDVLAHPASREGLGVALLEAASAGVPVVACDAGGVPDVVDDGHTGLLVPTDDAGALRAALARLLHDRAERARLGAAARAHVERRFDVASLVDAHLSLYRRVRNARAAAAAPTVMS
jgi:glycosyltransferase involved in cell wall biosynthesis